MVLDQKICTCLLENIATTGVIEQLFFYPKEVALPIIINFNAGLFSAIFVTCAGKVILNDIFVLILCFISYRVLFVGRPFQELPQNVFVSRLAQY